ncbi:hypothetical protein BJX76DRAFT_355098 [Aspergillus varians]
MDHTPVTRMSAEVFNSKTEFVDSVFLSVQAANHHQELVYTEAPATWAIEAADYLDERLEAKNTRKHYNSKTFTLWIRIMPTRIHDCHQIWYGSEKVGWQETGIMTPNECRYLKNSVGTTITFVGGPYHNSRKEPDLLLYPDNRSLPTLVIESGWGESLPRLGDDMNLWLVGGGGAVEVTIILNWRLNIAGRVKGDLQVYSLDRNGKPVLKQTEVIFPAPHPTIADSQVVNITRKQLLGGAVLRSRNPHDNIPWSLNGLRETARDALQLMGLTPA